MASKQGAKSPKMEPKKWRRMRRHNRNPINLPAACAKPAAIVIEAAGPQASSPTGSNCTVQVVGGGVISVGAVSGPPKNMLLSAHFLSQLHTCVGLSVGELVKDELNMTNVASPKSDDVHTTATPPTDESKSLFSFGII